MLRYGETGLCLNYDPRIRGAIINECVDDDSPDFNLQLVEWRDGSIHTVDDNDPTVVRCLQWGQLYGVENIDWGQFYCSPEYAFVLQLLS